MKKLICAIVLTVSLMSSNLAVGYATSPAINISQKETVSIISPSTDVVYTKDLLISIRVAEQKTLKLKVIKIVDEDSSILVHGPLTFGNNSNLNFYTSKINNIKPGTYRIVVENPTDKSIVCKKDVVVKEKQTTAVDKIFEEPSQNNAIQFIQTVITNIFGGQEK